jgi:hypothetical protein
MRISGRAKGDKITSYTHAVVQPNAPKSRYIMSYHSSEKKAKEYVDKYSKHIPGGLDIIKKTGKSTKTDYFNEEDTSMEEKNKGLWHNIHMKRKRGEKMRKKGDPGAPTQAALKSAQGKTEDMTSTASIPNPADTAMGPRIKTTTMHDKRRKKDQFPVLLKRFRKYIEDHG